MCKSCAAEDRPELCLVVGVNLQFFVGRGHHDRYVLRNVVLYITPLCDVGHGLDWKGLAGGIFEYTYLGAYVGMKVNRGEKTIVRRVGLQSKSTNHSHLNL